MARKPPTRSGLVSRPRKGNPPSYSDFRRLTPVENEREGFSRKARRYILKSVRKLTKRTPTISARQHETLRTRQEYGLASPEIATRARQSGALSYKTAAQEQIANKGAETHFRNRASTEIERDASAGKRIAEYAGGSKKKKRGGYRVKGEHAECYLELRQRKLDGEYIDSGDWHFMMDFAEKYKDPKRKILRASPGAFRSRETI